MNGEKLQWLILDDEVFSFAKGFMTTDEIAKLRGECWYRPLVRYEMAHETSPGVITTEIYDTGHWLENLAKLQEMRARNGIEAEE